MGKERARTSFRHGTHHTYIPEKTASYEKNVGTNYKRLIRHKFAKGVPLKANITALYPIPKRASKKVKQEMKNGNIFPTVKPDCGNVIKIILDSLNKNSETSYK